MNLNFNGLTKLKDWWGVVKANFQELVNKDIELDGKIDSKVNELQSKDTELSGKIDKEIQKVKTTYASSTQYGLVKTPTKSGIVSYNGELTVNTNSQYGTSRTGDGKVVTASASESDIDAGTNNYKPIVPGNLRYAVISAAGKHSQNPVQIGTWLDGTPVWRTSFDTNLTSLDISDKLFSPDLRVRNSSHINCILNSYVFTFCKNDNAAGRRLFEEDGRVFTYVIREASEEGDPVRGYIEFVTPESNLKEE